VSHQPQRRRQHRRLMVTARLKTHRQTPNLDVCELGRGHIACWLRTTATAWAVVHSRQNWVTVSVPAAADHPKRPPLAHLGGCHPIEISHSYTWVL
jgi:hypothetical protein